MEYLEHRCRYEDCTEQNPVAEDKEQVTCSTCRKALGLETLEHVVTIRLVVLSNGNDASVLEVVNSMLDNGHFQDSINEHECEGVLPMRVVDCYASMEDK